jgi:putative transposase
VIQIGEGRLRSRWEKWWVASWKWTLDTMLEAEADRICRDERFKPRKAQKGTLASSYQRHLQTKTTEVTLKVPKLRDLPTEPTIIVR